MLQLLVVTIDVWAGSRSIWAVTIDATAVARDDQKRLKRMSSNGRALGSINFKLLICTYLFLYGWWANRFGCFFDFWTAVNNVVKIEVLTRLSTVQIVAFSFSPSLSLSLILSCTIHSQASPFPIHISCHQAWLSMQTRYMLQQSKSIVMWWTYGV